MSVLFKLKDHFKENQLYQSRTVAAAVVVLLLFLTLISRLVYLQIYQHTLYDTLASNNHVRVIPISANRGFIYDQNGILLAENIPIFSLEIFMSRVVDLDDTIAKLGTVVTITEDNIKAFQKQLKYKGPYENIHIRSNLTEEEVARFSVEKYQFPTVGLTVKLSRYYPHGATFAHVLGYIAPVSDYDLSKIDALKYRSTQQIGKSGIERSYESILHGNVGYDQVEADARGRVIRTISTTLPIPGENIYLTLDSRLQIIADNLLKNKQGAIIAVDTRTGGILALVSKPSYEPNLFMQGIDRKAYNAIQNSKGLPLFNRAIRGQYPPGSIIKPLLGLQALEHGIVTSTEQIYDPGYYQLHENGRLFRDWKPKGHGFINLEHAIAESCTTFFYYISDKLGIERIHDIYHRFGLGIPVGIDIGGEAYGIAPSPTWKREFKQIDWFPGETLITGIGQGYTLVTPLQVAKIATTIANKGRCPQLTLLRSIQKQNSEHMIQPLPFKSMVELNHEKYWDIIIRGMELSVKDQRGTAHQIYKSNNLRIAGKTGTAQVFSLKQDEKYECENLHKRLRDHGWFMAFAPIEDPEIAIVVIVEHGKGSSVIAQGILEEYFKKQTHG